jgi:hypothetical protein
MHFERTSDLSHFVPLSKRGNVQGFDSSFGDGEEMERGTIFVTPFPFPLPLRERARVRGNNKISPSPNRKSRPCTLTRLERGSGGEVIYLFPTPYSLAPLPTYPLQ